MDPASCRDRDRRSGTEFSLDRARNSRSESPREHFDSHSRAHSISSSFDPQEGNSGDKTNVAQPNTQEVADTPVITTGAIIANAKPDTGEVSAETQETELEAEILEVFGERLRPERMLAPAVHSHLAALWLEIIEKGLPAEERKGFLKKISPPHNCVFIDPPKLNLEVKAALDSTVVKRDERIVEKQKKVAASLAGVGKVIDLLIKSNLPDKKQYLEPLNGVAKLLADLQHDGTSIRKSLILKNIKAPFKDTLKDLSSSDWLFGKELSEKIKAAKVLQQSSKDLKQPANPD
ncbi:uncharacterized protein LOC124293850 [Neodiprion lecontei]|uniref:Uncharacterized protein LOC124293850 n=1 Tax=Neodiprion lecontei TaxID=441921 RepID=A0ABM3FWL8_NEOLC|nr:uncharacterized protein LOC124293850 [Neodiprion lecontei]